MSYREEIEKQYQLEEQGTPASQSLSGAPGGARQHVRSGTEQGAVARPGGATQHSGGAPMGNAVDLAERLARVGEGLGGATQVAPPI